MATSPYAPWQLASLLLKAERERALAEKCREMARVLHFRPDRERVLEMARQHDVEAARLEAKAQE